jgi:hypothetical protein
MGYLELGLVDLAEAEVSRIDITQKETREIIEIKRQIAFARGNFSAVRDLSMASIENSQDPAVDMYAISLAGNSEWLYSRCIGFESMCQSDYLYWFNRACFACQAGNFRDSLESLRKGFTLSDRNHAQAFLDHDLESLWNWMGVTPSG